MEKRIVICPDCGFEYETDKNPEMDLIRCPRCGEFMYNKTNKTDFYASVVTSEFFKNAIMEMGHTIETENYRIHRYSRTVEVTDLANAGLRGKTVKIISFEYDANERSGGTWIEGDEFYDLMEKIQGKKTFNEIEKLIKETVKSGIYESTRKGIDITPPGFKPISITGKGVSIDADYNNFRVRDLADVNEETCIPAIAGGKRDIKVFYRWVSDNQDKLKNMTFSEVAREMMQQNIRYHRYCAMD